MCSALTVSVALLAACAQQAAAQDVQFAQSVSTFSMPGGASTNDVIAQATSCGSADSCVSVGDYRAGSGDQQALVIPITDGTPGASSGVTSLPSDAASPGQQEEQLSGVSCWSAGACIAVGQYTGPDPSSGEGLVVPISGGSSSVGEGLSLPADHDTSPPQSQLNAVGCWSAGSCVAVGYYDDQNQNQDALVVPFSRGVQSAGLVASLPAGAATVAGDQTAQLTAVSCDSKGACVAVGSYDDTLGDQQALVVPIVDGTPRPGVEVQLPPGAAANPNVKLTKISCWSAGSCVETGDYTDSSHNQEAFVVPITKGQVGAAVEVGLPADAANSTETAQLEGLSCSAAGACDAVGSYTDQSSNTQALVVPIDEGTAGTAVEVALPQDAFGSVVQNATLQSVSCPPTGACLAAGSYLDAGVYDESMTVAISSGIVATATTVPAPVGETTSSPYAELSTVGCSSSGSCAALGGYDDTSGNLLGYEVSLGLPLTIGNSSLPGATVGSSYRQTLTAAGAWGDYSWSVSAGSLPPGLSLNAQTGVVSGTATTAGTATFTVQAAGLGLPAETATQRLSIDVAAAATKAAAPPAMPTVAVPHIRVSGGLLRVKGNRFRVKLSCAGVVCSGTVKADASEVVTVRHGRQRIRKHRTVVIGRALFSVAAGRSGPAKMTLDRTGRRLLAGARGHRLAVELLAKASGGNSASHRATLWMRAAKKRKR